MKPLLWLNSMQLEVPRPGALSDLSEPGVGPVLLDGKPAWPLQYSRTVEPKVTSCE